MQNNDQLRYVRNADINFQQYDECLARSSNARVYARSWYLNVTAGQWDLLVWGDYEYAMPLPVKMRWGVKFVHQPFFTQQLGIFPHPPDRVAREFLLALRKKFPFFQFQSLFPLSGEEMPGTTVVKRRNRILSLEPGYEKLAARYSENTRRNLQKASASQLTLTESLSSEEYLRLKKESLKMRVPAESFAILERLISESKRRGTGKIVGATGQEGRVVAATFLWEEEGRGYYLNAFSTPEGMQKSAAFAIVDHFICAHSGTPFTIDFKGSDNEGTDRFYRGFGAREENYFLTTFTRIPAFLFMIKDMLRPK